MHAYPPDIPELVRAYRKDDENRNELTARLNDIVQGLCSTSTWFSVAPYVPLAADLLYYTATTIAGSQTIGEEYVGLLPVCDKADRQPPYTPPSILRRIAYVLLHTVPMHVRAFLPYAIQDEDSWRSWALRLASFVARTHLGLFYINGRHYELSRQVTAQTFVSIRPQQAPPNMFFAAVGLATIAHAVLSLLFDIRNAWHKRQEKKQEEIAERRFAFNKTLFQIWSFSDDNDGSVQCVVCLSPRKTHLLALCGHRVCSACARRLDVCYACRGDIERLIPLYNL